MDTNGDGALSQLRAELRAHVAAFELAVRELGQTWRPRLVDVERDVDVIMDALAQGGDVAASLRAYLNDGRRARSRATEDDHAD